MDEHFKTCLLSMLPFFSGMILSDLADIGTKEDGIEQLKICVRVCARVRQRQTETGEELHLLPLVK